MTGLELIFDYFEDHVRAAAHVNESKPLALGVFCFLISGLSLFVFSSLGLGVSLGSVIPALIWKLVAGFLMTGMLHLLLDFSGSKGSAAALFVLLGLASLVWTLTVPLALLARLLFKGSVAASILIFMFVGSLSLTLKARSLQDNYHIGAGRAWAFLTAPYLASGAFMGLAIGLAFVELIAALFKAFQ